MKKTQDSILNDQLHYYFQQLLRRTLQHKNIFFSSIYLSWLIGIEKNFLIEFYIITLLKKKLLHAESIEALKSGIF